MRLNDLLLYPIHYIDGSMYFDVTPTRLSTSGEWVTVYWSGVSSPSSKDIIGVYSPPASNGYGVNTSTAPIKYQVWYSAYCVIFVKSYTVCKSLIDTHELWERTTEIQVNKHERENGVWLFSRLAGSPT